MSIILADRPFGKAERQVTQPRWFHQEQPYLDFLAHIYTNGVDKEDRTGTGTRSIFGYMMRFNLQRALPLLSTKAVPQKTVFDELKWFLEGNTNNNRLREINQMHSTLDWSQRDTIWTEWADPITGALGPIYSDQWRNFRGKAEVFKSESEAIAAGYKPQSDFAMDGKYGVLAYEGFDQIQEAINLLKNSPDSRRILVSAWNPSQLKDQKLPPCHVLFQFYTRPASIQERRSWYNKNSSTTYHRDIASAYKNEHDYFDSYNVPRRVLECMLYQRSDNERLH